ATDLSCFGDSRCTTLGENCVSRESVQLDNGLDLMDCRIFKTLSTRGKCDGPDPVVAVASFVPKDLATEFHNGNEELKELCPPRLGTAAEIRPEIGATGRHI
ncbi:hypothetical protein CLAIMM_01771, partial [Cladophialophora immunda]